MEVADNASTKVKIKRPKVCLLTSLTFFGRSHRCGLLLEVRLVPTPSRLQDYHRQTAQPQLSTGRYALSTRVHTNGILFLQKLQNGASLLSTFLTSSFFPKTNPSTNVKMATTPTSLADGIAVMGLLTPRNSDEELRECPPAPKKKQKQTTTRELGESILIADYGPAAKIPALRTISLQTAPFHKGSVAFSSDCELAVAADDSVHIFAPGFPGTQPEPEPAVQPSQQGKAKVAERDATSDVSSDEAAPLEDADIVINDDDNRWGDEDYRES